ncbi:filamin-binding LIM protein 1 [Rhinophrynus dorsalis]
MILTGLGSLGAAGLSHVCGGNVSVPTEICWVWAVWELQPYHVYGGNVSVPTEICWVWKLQAYHVYGGKVSVPTEICWVWAVCELQPYHVYGGDVSVPTEICWVWAVWELQPYHVYGGDVSVPTEICWVWAVCELQLLSSSYRLSPQTHKAKCTLWVNNICAFCHKTILPSAAAIEAMKKQYHASCFTCRKCHRLLAGQLYYQKDGQPICDHCYKDTLEKCAKCQTLIMQHIVRAMGNGYHPECFTCVVCQRRIADESFAVDEYNDVHCADDYYRKYAPICNVCNKPIIPRDGQDSYKIECLGRNYHENCYRCERCHVTLSLEPSDSGCYPLKDHLLCKSCHLKWKDEFS